MGTCKYCGKSTGLFSNKHAECEDKHNEGLSSLSRHINDYFNSQIDFSLLKTKVENLRRQNYVTDADVICATQACLQSLSSSVHPLIPRRATGREPGLARRRSGMKALALKPIVPTRTRT